MTEQLIAKAFLISIMVAMAVSSVAPAYSASEPATKTVVSVSTDKTFYNMGETIAISGSVTHPPSDTVILKIFDSKAELVWLFVVTLDKDDSFKTSLQLSSPDWEKSTFYVLTAKAGDGIGSASFEIHKASASTYVPSDMAVPDVVKLVRQNAYIIPVSGLILAVLVIGILFSRRPPKSIATLRNEQAPLISYGPPSPARVYLAQGTSVSFDGWHKIPDDQKAQVDSIEFWIEIKNIGSDTAKDIKSSFLKKDGLLYRREMEEKGKLPEGQVLLPNLAPGHSLYWDFKIPLDRYNRLEMENLSVGLLSSYDKNKTKGYSGIIFGMGKGGNYTADEWFSH
ncbi:MAG: hypothetical protein KGI33_06935 [Thaumarchaeota archaeon]|nr:hypothetical protein [Nitrososphaerota archaeon]